MTRCLLILAVLTSAACSVPGTQGARCLLPLPMSLAGSDCDKDGFLSYDEALSYGAGDTAGTARSYTQIEFDAVDRDRNGKLDLAELHALLNTTYCWHTAARACPQASPSPATP
jgi:hypothetical protein